jgi:hypothetical protein
MRFIYLGKLRLNGCNLVIYFKIIAALTFYNGKKTEWGEIEDINNLS